MQNLIRHDYLQKSIEHRLQRKAIHEAYMTCSKEMRNKHLVINQGKNMRATSSDKMSGAKSQLNSSMSDFEQDRQANNDDYKAMRDRIR